MPTKDTMLPSETIMKQNGLFKNISMGGHFLRLLVDILFATVTAAASVPFSFTSIMAL